MPANPLAAWKEQFTFRASAEREFLHLSPRIRSAFLAIFPEFARHPWHPSPTLDVQPLRDSPERWRLKVAGGHRGIYRTLQGRPDFEMFQTREQVYQQLRRYLDSRP